MSQDQQNLIIGNYPEDSNWKSFYKLAGTASLLALLVMVLEIFITFLPGGGRTESSVSTITDWFDLFRNNWFMGLRNLGLMNIFSIIFGIPIYLALYAVHRQVNKAYAASQLSFSLSGYPFMSQIILHFPC